MQQFLREILEDPNVIVEHPGGSTWAVRGGRRSVLSTSTYGTERMSAGEIVGALLEQRQVRVTDEIEPGKRVLNLTETVAAQEKASEIGEKFSDWIWADPDRATRLARHYNDTFNAIVLRSYDGAQMQLPGLTVTFTPREHQIAAVARIVSEPSVLLAHEVGAGKTAEMVIGAMELRRLGMAQKPAVVVPNHMLEQFSREWMQLYPQARILPTSIDDLSRDKRRLLVARIATGDWDAVILSRSAFEKVPLSVGEQQRYLDTQLSEMRRRTARQHSEVDVCHHRCGDPVRTGASATNAAVSLVSGREVHLDCGVGVEGMLESLVRRRLVGADELGVGTGSVVLLGGECGGQLLTHVAHCARQRGGDAVRDLASQRVGPAGPGVHEPHKVVGILCLVPVAERGDFGGEEAGRPGDGEVEVDQAATLWQRDGAALDAPICGQQLAGVQREGRQAPAEGLLARAGRWSMHASGGPPLPGRAEELDLGPGRMQPFECGRAGLKSRLS